ncbi:MAG TPA: DUF4010 domain-containing protein [Caulobacteraceae bacterium]|nr:DUF4010 domain-containing protein [Caulobacteraceae bacterium]
MTAPPAIAFGGFADAHLISGLGVALGVGLLVGGERERRKRERSTPSAAGIRTFAIAALAGAVSVVDGGLALLATATAAASLLAAVGYWITRDPEDPGLTTELALVLTVLLGGLAMREPMLAAGVGAALALLLASRSPLHHFVNQVLTEREVHDALVLAGATLIVLPLLPDGRFGPYGAVNPRAVWVLVLLVLAIGAAGHIAVRALGPRFGLPVAGLAAGFVSSSATIGAMGARARKTPALLSAATAGAVLSTVATVVQMGAVIAVTSVETLRAMSPALISAGAAAVIYGAIFTLRALRQPPSEVDAGGRAFSLGAAIAFALVLTAVLVGAAALRAVFGEAGVVIAAAAAGLADTHAAAISVAALVTTGALAPADAVVPILAGFSTNTVAKIIFAVSSGERRFAARVVPGLLLVVAGGWIGGLAWARFGG